MPFVVTTELSLYVVTVVGIVVVTKLLYRESVTKPTASVEVTSTGTVVTVTIGVPLLVLTTTGTACNEVLIANVNIVNAISFRICFILLYLYRLCKIYLLPNITLWQQSKKKSSIWSS